MPLARATSIWRSSRSSFSLRSNAPVSGIPRGYRLSPRKRIALSRGAAVACRVSSTSTGSLSEAEPASPIRKIEVRTSGAGIGGKGGGSARGAQASAAAPKSTSHPGGQQDRTAGRISEALMDICPIDVWTVAGCTLE